MFNCLFPAVASCTVEEAGRYSMLYSYSNLITVFFGPLGGIFTDFMVRRAQRSEYQINTSSRLTVLSLCFSGMGLVGSNGDGWEALIIV